MTEERRKGEAERGARMIERVLAKWRNRDGGSAARKNETLGER